MAIKIENRSGNKSIITIKMQGNAGDYIQALHALSNAVKNAPEDYKGVLVDILQAFLPTENQLNFENGISK